MSNGCNSEPSSSNIRKQNKTIVIPPNLLARLGIKLNTAPPKSNKSSVIEKSSSRSNECSVQETEANRKKPQNENCNKKIYEDKQLPGANDSVTLGGGESKQNPSQAISECNSNVEHIDKVNNSNINVNCVEDISLRQLLSLPNSNLNQSKKNDVCMKTNNQVDHVENLCIIDKSVDVVDIGNSFMEHDNQETHINQENNKDQNLINDNNSQTVSNKSKKPVNNYKTIQNNSKKKQITEESIEDTYNEIFKCLKNTKKQKLKTNEQNKIKGGQNINCLKDGLQMEDTTSKETESNDCVRKPKRRKTANQSLIENTEIILGKRTPKLNAGFVDYCTRKKQKRIRTDSESSVISDEGCNIFNSTMIKDTQGSIDLEFYNMYLELQNKITNENCNIICLLCKQHIKNNWDIHKLMHNNLVEELAIVSDAEIVNQTLTDILNKTGILICEKCCYSQGDVKSFCLHKKICSISSKKYCKICGRTWVKQTRNGHMQLHKSNNFNLNQKNPDKCGLNISNINSETDDSDSIIVCAMCKKEMPYLNWNQHNLIHNNLSWIKGQKPIDMSISNIKKIISPILKKNKKITCSNCGCDLDSVLKFIEHRKICQEKIEDDETNNESKILRDKDYSNDDPGLDNTINKVYTVEEKPDVTCARCNKSIPNIKWSAHKLKHNNLAWNNEEDPIDLNDKRNCVNILNRLMKKNKVLKCEFCDVRKKSALGFYSHIEKCNKTNEEILLLRVPCTLCGRLYSKSSLQVHINQVHKQTNQETDSISKIDENLDDSRTKRKAASKALTLIEDFKKKQTNTKTIDDLFTTPCKIRMPNPVILCWKKEISSSEDGKANCRNISCNFRHSDIDELKKHYAQCELHPRRCYWCKVCNFRCAQEHVIKEHVTNEHKSELEKKESENNLDEGVKDKDFNVDESENQSESESESESEGENENIKIAIKIKNKTENKNENENDDEYENENENDLEDDLSGEEWDDIVENVDVKHNYLKRSRGVSKFSFLLKDSTQNSQYYERARIWTLQFREFHYSKEPLFRNLCNTISDIVPSDLHASYLCADLENSTLLVSITGPYNSNVKPEKVNWKSYEQFQGFCDDQGIATMFCGGPVWGLAWCPLHTEKESEQFVAVSTHRSFDDGFQFDNKLHADTKGVIQIWNMGVMNNEVGKCTSAPKLSYMIAHDFGAIWKLEWCPSGGFYEFEQKLPSGSEDCKRLGLLAAACSDGNVYIYSICIPKGSDLNRIPLFYQLPIVVLRTKHESCNFQTTALSWTKEKHHNIIAAGYSTGFVSLWNLSTESKLLNHAYGDSSCIHPMIIFKAHRTVISGIVIFPYANGCCLFTTSYDRSIQYWHIDPKTGSATAFPLKGTFGRSNCITTATSNIHWITPLISLDEVFGFGHANSSFVSLRDFTYRSAIILNALSQIWDLAACDWTNGFCQVTEGGEISAIYPQQLMAHIDNCKRIKKMRLVLGLCKIYKLECDDKLDKIDCEKSENSKTLIDKKSCNENEQNETVKINSSEQIDNSDEDNHINFSLNKTIEINERNDEMILNVPENDLNCLAVSNNKLSDTQDIASGSNLDEETIWESNYKDIKQKYGLIFYDLPTSLKDGTYDTNYFKKTPLTHYPLNALTRVDYNPNERSYGFVAIGMYAGFVRVRYIGEVQNPETN